MQTKQLQTAGLVVLQDQKVLLAYSKNKKAWYLPGGKIENGETAFLSLKREIREELNLDIHTEDVTYFGYITAPAYGEAPHIIMEQECFLYTLGETVQPGNEILAVAYFDEETYKKEPAQVPGVLQLFAQLKQNRPHDAGSYD
ncbi:NUDIX hydrolase [Niabella drilacis]|uniref:ADP-ribose pyrophosphatase YjhB, NUDIX family n=1 Tax=Niabella drilacis (strain DSM 25811 / CCM 8410 / CCUG 62505 / LMG 26954 / E90) TaxID=1285928 RepID=A0A1G6KVR1_NIADE|nr:NUDIX domain-containing protein [Niabella drilacis]SDC34486.1 ADP-ribose pyrophosphatase YjhB, NUDIX family [Niabella drilacis]